MFRLVDIGSKINLIGLRVAQQFDEAAKVHHLMIDLRKLLYFNQRGWIERHSPNGGRNSAARWAQAGRVLSSLEIKAAISSTSCTE